MKITRRPILLHLLLPACIFLNFSITQAAENADKEGSGEESGRAAAVKAEGGKENDAGQAVKSEPGKTRSPGVTKRKPASVKKLHKAAKSGRKKSATKKVSSNVVAKQESNVAQPPNDQLSAPVQNGITMEKYLQKSVIAEPPPANSPP